jgi:NAD(P)-dependent dehydrogenase (short-subunit alcohol dehydrogenase family)
MKVIVPVPLSTVAYPPFLFNRAKLTTKHGSREDNRSDQRYTTLIYSPTNLTTQGANRGIGYETAKNLLLHSAKYHVLLGCRSLSRGASAASDIQSTPGLLGTVTVLQVDVTSDESIKSAFESIKTTYGHLDILVLNAGIFGLPPGTIEPSSLRSNFTTILSTNVVSALVLTETFLPLLTNSRTLSPPHTPRLIFVSSSVGSLSQAADPESKYHHPGASEYRASKAALNMLMVQYWVRLKGEGFLVHGADPGLVATDFLNREQVKKRGAVEEWVGGERIASVVRGDRDADVGRVCGEYGVSPF